MAKAKRPLTVMKVEWTVAPRGVPTSGILGTLKVTIEEDGVFVSSLRDIKVKGRIRTETKAEERRRLSSPHEFEETMTSLVGTYRVTKLEYPGYKKMALATVNDLKPEERLLMAASDIVRGKVASTLPKVQKVTVVLWDPKDPSGTKAKKLELKKWEAQREKEELSLHRAIRGPGRHPKNFDWADIRKRKPPAG